MSHTSDPSQKENTLVHSEAPKQIEPHFGHAGTNFEGTDAKAGIVVTSLGLIGGTLVVVFFFTVFIQRHIQHENPIGVSPSALAPGRVVPPAPQLQVQPWEDLPEMRAHENQVLNSTGKDAEGHYHIPISEAMNVVVSRLKIEPDAPQGLTTPGGGGRVFSGSITSMPPEYRKPVIQGEIQKHAQ